MMILGKCSSRSDLTNRTETKFRLLIIATSGACRASCGADTKLPSLKFYIVCEAWNMTTDLSRPKGVIIFHIFPDKNQHYPGTALFFFVCVNFVFRRTSFTWRGLFSGESNHNANRYIASSQEVVLLRCGPIEGKTTSKHATQRIEEKGLIPRK